MVFGSRDVHSKRATVDSEETDTNYVFGPYLSQRLVIRNISAAVDILSRLRAPYVLRGIVKFNNMPEDKELFLKLFEEIGSEWSFVSDQKHNPKNGSIPLPNEEFGVIYADPPWQYEVSHLRANPEKYYPTLPLDEICKCSCDVHKACTPRAHYEDPLRSFYITFVHLLEITEMNTLFFTTFPGRHEALG